MEITLVLGLFVAALVLFAMERFPVDVVTLGLIALLILTGVLSPKEAFAGFGSELLVMLGAIFVISSALQRSGVLQWLATTILRWGGRSEAALTGSLMTVAGLVSAFMNNTAVTAMFLAPVIGVAKKANLSPSRLLMPLAFASILGGTCTLVGTSTNVAVSGFIASSGLPPLGLFEIAPVGLAILVTGIAYTTLVARRWLPAPEEQMVTPGDALRAFLCEATVLENSPLVGQRVFDWDLLLLDCRILKIIRSGREFLPGPDERISAGDHLLIEGNVENLIKIQRIEGLRIETRREALDAELRGSDVRVAEVLIAPDAEVTGHTLRDADFRQRYGLTVMAINRRGKPLIGRLGEVELDGGDVLLVQGKQDRLVALRNQLGLHVLDQREAAPPENWKGWLTPVLFLLAVLVGAAGWVPMSVSFLSAALLSILAGCVSIDAARESIDWRLLILIGGMTAFGTAMETSGAANLLAKGVVGLLSPMGVMAVLAGFFVLTIVLTQPMSNAAAALVVLPVAMAAARDIGASERTFAIAVMLAASVSFLTPFEPSCVLVYGPGKYRFRDFVRVGGGLTVVLTVLTLWLIPVFWPLLAST